MDFSKFEQTAFHELQEGDYVLIHLDQKFIQGQHEAQERMKQEAMGPANGTAQKSSKHRTDMPIPTTPTPVVDSPAPPLEVSNFAFGKVDEVTVGVLGLVDAYEELDPQATTRVYEARQCRKIRKVDSKQYQELIQSLQKASD